MALKKASPGIIRLIPVIGVLLLCILLPAQGLAQNRAPAELFEGFVYFSNQSGTHLKALPRHFPAGLDSHELGRQILGVLMAGPPVPGLAPTFPPGTRVSSFFITDKGEAYVDLGFDRERFEPCSTMAELLGIYSLVNSLTVNIPVIRQVRILLNGGKSSSLGGHVRLDYFFKTNMLMVK